MPSNEPEIRSFASLPEALEAIFGEHTLPHTNPHFDDATPVEFAVSKHVNFIAHAIEQMFAYPLDQMLDYAKTRPFVFETPNDYCGCHECKVRAYAVETLFRWVATLQSRHLNEFVKVHQPLQEAVEQAKAITKSQQQHQSDGEESGN